MVTKSEAFPSPYYNANDVKGRPILLTIQGVAKETMPSDGEEKYCAAFLERDSKRLVITSTKWDEIAAISGTDDCDNWGNTKIVLYLSSARYAGKIVPSIGIRAPRNLQQTQASPAIAHKQPSVLAPIDADRADALADDIPF